ncbi:hypothetical protein [Bifidobacterium sp.]|uniref:hypothetical protein n=1 Tax=Bifidobacterium sp. TaxID=41200 RepID=UPI0025B7F49E|nr:hypothetical protein [Bifidobacterium sp.]MCI1635623.1 hypothetical protein [Bifidobacterium sp.]
MTTTSNKLRFAAGAAALALLASASFVGAASAAEVGTGDHNIDVTVQIYADDAAVVVTLPSGFNLDGNAPDDVSEWVGDSGNISIDEATGFNVAVNIAEISDNKLVVSSGSNDLEYGVRINTGTEITAQDGTELLTAGDGETATGTLQARFVGGVVDSDAEAGDYSGQLTFTVVAEEAE